MNDQEFAQLHSELLNTGRDALGSPVPSVPTYATTLANEVSEISRKLDQVLARLAEIEEEAE